MTGTVIQQLEKLVASPLKTIKDDLEANRSRPIKAVAQPPVPAAYAPQDAARQGLAAVLSPVAANPKAISKPDPKAAQEIVRLNLLIALLTQAFQTSGTKQNLTLLAGLMGRARKLTEELEKEFNFWSVKFSKDGNTVDFREISKKIAITSVYYDRLAFYLLPEGKKYLTSVVNGGGDGAREDGKVPLHELHWEENIDPILHGNWRWNDYRMWAAGRHIEGKNVLDHIVDFLLEHPPWLTTVNVPNANKARFSPREDLRWSVEVQIHTDVPGSEDFSSGTLPRMWTYQIRVAKRDQEKKGTEWSADVTARGAVGVPVLRPVDSPPTEARGAVGSEFIYGNIYAMDGPTKLYCFPPSKHHSAFLSGAPVSAAGVLFASQGRVRAIDNRSGHYRPGFRQLLLAVQYIMDNGLNEPDAFVSLIFDFSNPMYFSFPEFRYLAGRGFPFDSTADVLRKRAEMFLMGLPIPDKYFFLIPEWLKDFPMTSTENRWDKMLTGAYCHPGADLKGIVKELTDLLQKESAIVGGASTMPDTYPARVRKFSQELAGGGAYCKLHGILEVLYETSKIARSKPGTDVISKYSELRTRLRCLQPKLQWM